MEEVTRLSEIIASIKDALLHRSFEAGKFLIKLENGANYGDWKTFDNFVESELRIKVRTARRLMFAYQMRELLKERGRLLPVSEASVRPLLEQLREDRQLAKKKLKLDDLRVKAWDDACLMKEKSTPTGTDVSRAVRRLMGPRVDTTTDPAFRAYRRHAHRVKSETAKMIKLMPDLAGSLADNDNKTKRQKKDMAKLLEKQTMWSNQQFLTFDGTWTPNRKLFEEGDYLAALAKAKRLERMVVILRVRDFIHRTGIKVPLPKVNTPAHPLPATAYAESLDMWINRDHH